MSRGGYKLGCLVFHCVLLAASGLSNFPTFVSGTGDHTCVILKDSRTKCWGSNVDGHLGLGDTENRGDQEGEMGNNLPALDFGTGRRAVALGAGAFHRCAILDNGQLKCWGKGKQGQLGYEDKNTRGAAPGEMGDDLPPVALGAGLTAVLVTAGDYHTCVVVSNGRMKCWGSGGQGQLGREDRESWGNAPGQMGDNLPYVELGEGRTVIDAASGDLHTCVLLDNGSVKCFGDGHEGQLGYGDHNQRGNQAGQMGDNLPVVDLGTGRTAKQVSAGWFHSCALLDDATVKCWGFGRQGQLGQGDTTWYGKDPNQMGDNLPPIKLGTGRTALLVTAGYAFTCVVLDTRDIKCWGFGSFGRTGSGSTDNIGTQPEDMGDNLPVLDLGAGFAGKAMMLEAGDLHCCVVTTDGLMKCWGRNNNGQLGIEETQDHGGTPTSMGDNLPSIDFGSLQPTLPPVTTTATSTVTLTSTRTTTTETNTTTSTTATTSTATLTSTTTSTTNTNTSTTTTFTTTTLLTTTATTITTSTSTFTDHRTLVHSDVSTSVRSLGFTINGVPPTSPIRIVSVEPGSWANLSSVVPGDTLESINGVSVGSMSADDFLQTLQSRPLSLDITHSSMSATPDLSFGSLSVDQPDTSILLATVASNLSFVDLGLTTRGMPPDPVTLALIEPGSWADVNGLEAGDQVLSINGMLVASLSPDEFTWFLSVTRPLELLLSRRGSAGTAAPPVTGSQILFTAVDGLAFSIGALPPGPVCVSSVLQGLWADRAGVRPGDQVVSVNGLEVSNATSQEVLPLFMTRPLLLRLAGKDTPDATCTSGEWEVPVDGGSITVPSATEDLDGFGSLGFTLEVFSGAVPRIAAVEEGLWAQRQGFLIGDQVVTIDSNDPSGMDVSELLRRLHEVRPLSITLFRSLAPVAPPAQNRTLLADVGQFGFSFEDWTSPNRSSDRAAFLVADTQQLGWASRSGLAPGQSLLEVNGVSVSDMQPGAVFETLQRSRPLSMTFSVSLQTPICCAVFPIDLQVATATVTAAQQGIAGLGFTLNGIRIWSVEPDKWASASGLRPGDALVSVNGRPLATSQDPTTRRLAGIQFNELKDMLEGTRPLSLVVEHSAYWERDSQQDRLDLLGSPELLGFSVDSVPPGRVTVAAVADGGWAARNGLQVGFELLMIDGLNVSDLNGADFMQTIQERRPLSLTLLAPRDCAGENCSKSVLKPTPVDGPYQVTIVANATDQQPGLQRLGFSTDGQPPNRVQLLEIEPNLWADQSGILAGDELVSINGQSVSTLAPEEVHRLLDKERPISFVITRTARGLDDALAPPTTQREAWDLFTGNNFLGFSVGALPPNRVCITGLEPNLWATRIGLPLAAELLKINVVNVSTMDAREFGRSLQQIRPLQLSFITGSNCSESTLHVPADRWPYRTQALESDPKLSFLVSGLPPQLVRVAAVTPGGWAARVGVVPGDELLQIGDTHVSDMTADELMQRLKTRPLLLMFAPRFGSSGGTADANQTAIGMVVDSPVFTARAQPFDLQLGFSVSGSPPGSVRISSAETGRWAANTGLSVGDELVSVNGQNTSTLTPQELVKLLQDTRPLDLQFISKTDLQPEAVPGNASNCSYQPALATGADYELGMYVGPLTQGIASVIGVERGMWAQRSGARVGDMLCSLDGKNVSDLQQQEVLNLLQQVRPLSLTFCRCEALPNQSRPVIAPGMPVDKVPEPYLANATDADPRLGFSITQLPSGKVLVAGVTAESWSSRSGVAVGDELQYINGQPVANMSLEAMEQMLGDMRPLALGFSPSTTLGNSSSAGGAGGIVPVDHPDFQAIAGTSDAGLGFQVRRLPAGSRATQSQDKILVDSTAAGTWASRSGLHPGDELVSINGIEVSNLNPAELMDLLRRTRPLRLKFSAPHGLPSADDSNCTNITSTATAEQTDLGCFVSFASPPVTVAGVQPGSWAHRIGVLAGDFVRFLNGLNVSATGREAAEQLWASRPLTVVFSRCSADESDGPPNINPNRYSVNATVSDDVLGFFLSGSAPGPLQVASVPNGTWAARLGLAVGDLLEFVNGIPVSNFSSQGELLLALQQRPVSLGMNLPSKNTGDNTTDLRALPADPPIVTNVTATLMPVDTRLGFSVTALPPGQVFVAAVEPQQWAARSGLLVGDELLAINGRNVSNLTSQDFLQLLQESRPFTLSLSRLQVALVAMQSGQACDDFSANASMDAPDLGLFVTPVLRGGPVWPVAGVVRGIWADTAGIVAGDLLTMINSQNVSLLSQQDLRALLTDRPFSLAYRRCNGTPSAGIPVDKVRDPFSATTGNATRLGFSLAATASASLWRVAAVQERSWAAGVGVQVGDILTTVGGATTSGMAKEALWALLQSGRPLLLSFAPRMWSQEFISSPGNSALVAAMPVDSQDYTASARKEDDLLSFSLAGRPPNVRVAFTGPDSWAERSGLGIGDMLLTVNRRNVFQMSIGELLRMFQDVRPLDLTFNASAPGVGFPVPSLDPDRLSCAPVTAAATPADAELGLFVGRVFGDGAPVVGVETGLWAQLGGILLGDQLYTVNDRSVATMQDKDLVNLLSTRPLSLTFRRCSGPQPEPVQTVDAQGYVANFSRPPDQLGLALNGAAPGRMRVGAVVGGSWADATGVKVGDELLQVNGQDVSEMANEEVFRQLRESPVLSLFFMPRGRARDRIRPDGWPTDLTVVAVDLPAALNYEAVATVADTALGFSVYGLPPGQVVVGALESGKWASRFGMNIGDVLQTFNGRNLSTMAPHQLMRGFHEMRPFRITFSRDPSKAHMPELNVAASHDCPAFRALAVPTDRELGLFTASSQDQRGVIVGLEAGMWAESYGMVVGDVITSADRKDVSGMTQTQLMTILSETRPLFIVFIHCIPHPVGVATPNFEAIAGTSDLQLGFTPIQAFDFPGIVVGVVEDNSWAYGWGLEPGDQLLAVNGVNPMDLQPLELMRVLRQDRPLNLTLQEGHGVSPAGALLVSTDGRCFNFTAIASDADPELGLFIDIRQVDSKPVPYVSQVEPQLWSSIAGMAVDDLILQINGRDTREMEPAELMTTLEVMRPLTILFSHCGPLPTTTTTSMNFAGQTPQNPGGQNPQDPGGQNPPGTLGPTVPTILPGIPAWNGTLDPDTDYTTTTTTETPSSPSDTTSTPVPLLSMATSADGWLGFGLMLDPGTGQIVVTDPVEPDSWASKNGVLPGYVLLFINGTDASGAPLSRTTSLLSDLSARPLVLAFAPKQESPGAGEPDSGSDVDDRSQYTVGATEEDVLLGFSPGLPPSPVSVLSIVAGSWAERVGLTPGDVLLDVNGTDPNTLSAQALLDLLRNTRPLTLIFSRGAGGPTAPPAQSGQWPWLANTTSTRQQEFDEEVLVSAARGRSQATGWYWQLMFILAVKL